MTHCLYLRIYSIHDYIWLVPVKTISHISVQECIAHPGNAEDGDYSLHSSREDRALCCFYSVCLSYQQNEGGSRKHDDFDNGGHP